MDARDPVREQRVDNMPDAEPHPERGPGRPDCRIAPACAVQHPQPHGGHGIHEGMKQAVYGHLHAQVRQHPRPQRRQQVVPLQDLVQQNPIEKTAHRKAQPSAGAAQAPLVRRHDRVHKLLLLPLRAAQQAACPRWTRTPGAGAKAPARRPACRSMEGAHDGARAVKRASLSPGPRPPRGARHWRRPGAPPPPPAQPRWPRPRPGVRGWHRQCAARHPRR